MRGLIVAKAPILRTRASGRISKAVATELVLSRNRNGRERGTVVVSCGGSFGHRRRRLLSEAFLARCTHLYLSAPFALKDLAGSDSSAGVRVKNGVNDVAATSLDTC